MQAQVPAGVAPGQAFLIQVPAAAAMSVGPIVPVRRGFQTTWSANQWSADQWSHNVMLDAGALHATDTSSSDGMRVCSAETLPPTGQHYFEATFRGCFSSPEYQAIGVWASSEPPFNDLAYCITKDGNPFWGLRGDGDNDALRVKGKGKGKVAFNKNRVAISNNECIGMLVDMDRGEVRFFRDGALIDCAIAGGFPKDNVRIAACCRRGSISLSCGHVEALGGGGSGGSSGGGASAVLPVLKFTAAHQNMEIRDNGSTAVKKSVFGPAFYKSAVCTDHSMAEGQHYAEFTLFGKLVQIGVVISSAVADILDTYCASRDESSWSYVASSGSLETRRGGDVKTIEWAGQQGAKQGDRIGLLLDLAYGSVVVYKNDIRLGTMAPSGTIRGPVCWTSAR